MHTKVHKPVRGTRQNSDIIVASAPSPAPIKRSQHYWKIHKKVMDEALEFVGPSGFLTIAHDAHHNSKFFQEFNNYCHERATRLYNSETYPFNDKWTFKNDPTEDIRLAA